MADDARRQRMFAAQQSRERALGRRLTLKQIADEVGAHLGREVPPAESVVRRWLRGEAEPELAVFRALAEVFGVSAGWLAFGDEPRGPSTDVSEVPTRPLLGAEGLITRDQRRAAKKRRDQQAG